jgi:hypothetical protein
MGIIITPETASALQAVERHPQGVSQDDLEPYADSE